MRRIISLFIAVLLLSSMAFAETDIHVTGSATVQLSADYAVISLGVQAREKSVLKAQSQVNETMLKIRAALEVLGIEKQSFSTDSIRISTYYESSRVKVDYYSASQTFMVKTTDLNTIGQLIDTAFANGATALTDISYYASDTSSAQAQAADLAVKDAKAKADVLAKSLGLKITGVSSVSQNTGYSSNLMSNYNFAPEPTLSDDYSPTLVQPNKINVSVSVTIDFIAEEVE